MKLELTLDSIAQNGQVQEQERSVRSGKNRLTSQFANLKRGPAGTLVAVCETVLPPVEISWVAERVVEALLKNLERLPPLSRRGFALGLRLFNWSPVLLFRSFRPFSRLAVSKRLEIFKRWQNSRLYFRREVARSLQAITIHTFYDLPELRASLGYSIESYVEECKKRRKELVEADSREGKSPPRAKSMILQ